MAVLPLLRRTFGAFPAPVRRQMGERVAGDAQHTRQASGLSIDEERANMVIPLLRTILGVR